MIDVETCEACMVTSKLTPAPGVLLVAPPLLRDHNFWRSVVLLCEHGGDGTIGLILNRPLTLDLKDVLDGLSLSLIHISEPTRPY